MTTEQDRQSVRELYNRTFAPIPTDEFVKAEKGLKINGIGTILAILMSAGSLIFTGGVLWGQVQTNSAKIVSLESRVDSTGVAIIRIDTNVTYLADRAKEDRATMSGLRK
jgi:hypothetical protein